MEPKGTGVFGCVVRHNLLHTEETVRSSIKDGMELSESGFSKGSKVLLLSIEKPE